MTALRSSASRIVLTLLCAGATAPVYAADINVPAGTTLTGQQTFGGTDTITVGTGATITSGSNPTLLQNSAATGVVIDNAGTIQSTGAGARAIRFNTGTAMTFTLTNRAGATITSQNDAIQINPAVTSGTIVVNNYGTIETTGTGGNAGQGIDFSSIVAATTSITINNYAGGVIKAADQDGVRPGNNGTVNNYGQIIANYSANTSNDGVDFQDATSGTVNNYGTIIGARHGINLGNDDSSASVTVYNAEGAQIIGSNGSGVGFDGSGVVTNYGLISGRINSDPNVANGDGDGIDIDYFATIKNYGTIEGKGAKGVGSDGYTNTSEGIALGGGTIINGDATHRSALITSVQNAILVDNSSTGDAYGTLEVVNYGTIQGLDGYGIKYVNSGANSALGVTITNYGIISGTTYAVSMGGGNDLFVYEAGSSVTGTVHADGGTDTFRLGEVDGTFNAALLGPSATYQDFEVLTLAAGSTWTLTSASSFAGATNVTAATLVLDGASLGQSVVTVAGASGQDGLLKGDGTVGTLKVLSGGVVSPGAAAGDAGLLFAMDGASFAAGSVYAVNRSDAGVMDTLFVLGTTTIETGAVVRADFATGFYAWNTPYTILVSTSGVSGQFALDAVNVPSYLFLAPELSQDAYEVYLTLARNTVPFTAFALNRNQFQVAAALDRTGPGGALEQSSALYDALVYATSEGPVRLAFTQLAGDIYPTLSGVLFTENTLVNDALLGRLRQAGYAGSPGAAAALGYGGPVASYVEPAPAKAGPFKAVKAPPAPVGPVWSAWVQGYGQWLNVDANAAVGVAKADSSVGGVIGGADVTFGNVVFGLAGGYSSSSTTSGSASADADTWRIAAYGGASFDALKLRAGATYGWSSIDASRFVALTSEMPQASYDATSANLFAEAGYTVVLATVALEPFAGIGWTAIDQDSFAETLAPVAGLLSTGTSFDTAYSTLGLRAAATFTVGSLAVTPHASAGWRHAFGDVTPTATLAFLETGSAFSVEGLAIAEDSLVASAGLDVALGGGFTLGVSYDGMFGDGASYNAGKATLSARF